MPFLVVCGKVISDNTGATRMLPVVLSPEGPVRPLIDYFLTVHRSLSWQEKLARSLRLFLEYLEKNALDGATDWHLFRNFANSMRSGTFDPASGEDPSGLCWEALGVRRSNQIIRQLSDFFEWLGINEAPRAANFNPSYLGNAWDQRVDLLAYQYRRGKSRLGYTWSGNPESIGRVTRCHLVPKVLPKRPPMFPEERFEELIFKGFRLSGRYDYRSMLITLLLFAGGLRVSEPFHLYVADVQPHWQRPEQAFVAVHHPSLGIAPNGWINRSGARGSRLEYLNAVFGLSPRHLVRGKHHAGWKSPALDDRWYMQVHWFPSFYGEWFLKIWSRYVEQIASTERHHPYAFINLGRAPVGGIYTIASYQKALQSAVERIGLVFGKVYGTTAHGHRHAYAQRARRGGVSSIIIQRLMHHCSPDSQTVYTAPDIAEATKALEQATRRLAVDLSAPTRKSASLILREY